MTQHNKKENSIGETTAAGIVVAGLLGGTAGFFGGVNSATDSIADGSAFKAGTQIHQRLSEAVKQSPEASENLRQFADQIRAIADAADKRRQETGTWKATLEQQEHAPTANGHAK